MRDARSRGCTLRPTHRHRTSARGLVSESRRSTALCSDKAYRCADGLRPRRRQSVSYHKPRTRVGGVRPVAADKQHRNRTPQQRPLPAEHLFQGSEHPQPDPRPFNQAAPDNGSGFNSRASVWSRPRTSETPCVKRSPWERHRLRLSSEKVDTPRLELGPKGRPGGGRCEERARCRKQATQATSVSGHLRTRGHRSEQGSASPYRLATGRRSHYHLETAIGAIGVGWAGAGCLTYPAVRDAALAR